MNNWVGDYDALTGKSYDPWTSGFKIVRKLPDMADPSPTKTYVLLDERDDELEVASGCAEIDATVCTSAKPIFAHAALASVYQRSCQYKEERTLWIYLKTLQGCTVRSWSIRCSNWLRTCVWLIRTNLVI